MRERAWKFVYSTLLTLNDELMQNASVQRSFLGEQDIFFVKRDTVFSMSATGRRTGRRRQGKDRMG